MQNTITIVTGAASGIGQQVAIQAAQLGSTVWATDVNPQGLAETKRSIEQAGGQVEAVNLDVSKPDEILSFARRVIPTLGGKKLVLVNNAGVALSSGTFEHTTLEDFEWLLSINLWGVVRMTKAFLPYMLDQNAGHIANVSSVFGLAGVMHQSAYCTAKFGVRGFTECLRMELMGTNIGTTVIHPGGIKTNIAQAARRGGKVTEEIHQKSAQLFDQTVPTTAAEAARQILDCVVKNKPRLVIGKDGRMVDWLTRLLPVGYTKIFKKDYEKTFGKFDV
jgi:NAD(P)-dependent dehydrogenase (short-subunit alcohol dehydrogenase family)